MEPHKQASAERARETKPRKGGYTPRNIPEPGEALVPRFWSLVFKPKTGERRR